MRSKTWRVLILSTMLVCLGAASELRADIPDDKNIADGAAKGQASEGIISSTGGYPSANDTTAGMNYYYQYFTDSSSTSTKSVVLFFYDGDPDRPVFEEFTGYTQTQLDNIASHISITNDNPAGGNSLTLSNVEYFISDTQIPLDSLNVTLPPSGFPSYPGSFAPLPNLDETLAPGASTPLPSSAWMGLVGMGLLGLSGFKRRGRLA